MTKFAFIIILSLFSTQLFAQQSIDTSSVTKDKVIIQLKENKYYLGDKRIKRLEPYLMSNSDAKLEYKKYKTNSTVTVIFMGACIGGLATALITNNKTIQLVALIPFNLTALSGMILFGTKAKKHLKRSIVAYNKNQFLF
jgi:hypothetical protein